MTLGREANLEGVPCEGTLLSFLLIDSSKTRDCQVNMSFEETSLSDRSVKLLQDCGEDYLLEVFRPWDCNEQRWADIDTFQFRFEAQDILVGRNSHQDEGSRQWEAFAGFSGVHQGSTVGLAEEGICWLVDNSLIEEPGKYGRIETLVQNVIHDLRSALSNPGNESV